LTGWELKQDVEFVIFLGWLGYWVMKENLLMTPRKDLSMDSRIMQSLLKKKQRHEVRKGERVIEGTSVNVNNILIFYCEITKYLNRNQISLL